MFAFSLARHQDQSAYRSDNDRPQLQTASSGKKMRWFPEVHLANPPAAQVASILMKGSGGNFPLASRTALCSTTAVHPPGGSQIDRDLPTAAALTSIVHLLLLS